MSTDIQVFQNPEFGQLRTVVKYGEPWFVAKDVCDKFGETNYRRSIRYLDEDEKGVSQINTPGGNQNMTVVNEAGLYSMLFAMQPQKARGVSQEYIAQRAEQLRRFKRWVTHDVIPSIRKHGAYMTPEAIEKVLCNPDTIIKLATELKGERQKRLSAEVESAQQKQIIAEMQPKASYYDKVLASPDPVLISVIAKDYGKSGTWLNKKLHELGIQFKLDGTWLLYQKYAEQGYTKSYTHTYTDSLGTSHSTILTCWTQKGRLFLYNVLREHGILPLMEQEDKRSA